MVTYILLLSLYPWYHCPPYVATNVSVYILYSYDENYKTAIIYIYMKTNSCEFNVDIVNLIEKLYRSWRACLNYVTIFITIIVTVIIMTFFIT